MTIFGGIRSDRREAADAAELLAARVAFARSNQAWTEIPEERLVRRGPGWLIDAESDLVYSVRRGQAFAPGGAKPHFVDPAVPAVFYVSREGELVLLERCAAARTWSEVVERRARKRVAS